MIYPKVAIVGRPNVGKSTLFNSLVGRKSAIVARESGVTRDRHDAFIFWNHRKFLLIDTGGLEPVAHTELDRLMYEQIQLALNEAKLIIFVLDSHEGLHPLDHEVAVRLRETGKPILYAVNKMDDPRHEGRELEFTKLGVEKLLCVSASHKLGLEALLDEIIEYLPKAEVSEEKIEKEIKIAIVGRPNVGKSTLTNKLLGEKRCIVSPQALTTRDAIDTYIIRDKILFTLIDTAGIRKRSRVETGIEFFSVNRSQKAIRRADVAFLVVDAVEKIVEQDVKIAELAIEAGTSLMILVNKWDAVEKDHKTAQNFEKDFRITYPHLHWAPLIFISAESGQRIHKLLDQALILFEDRKKRVDAETLNYFLRKKLMELPPPIHRGRRPKINKLAQLDVAPPIFYFKVSSDNSIRSSYLQYMINGLREEFGFEGTPVKVVFKKSFSNAPYHN